MGQKQDGKGVGGSFPGLQAACWDQSQAPAPRLLGLMNVGAEALTAREHNLMCASTNTSMHMPAQQLYQVAAGHSKTRDPSRQERTAGVECGPGSGSPHRPGLSRLTGTHWHGKRENYSWCGTFDVADSYALNASSLDTPCPSSQPPPTPAAPSRFKDIPADFHMLSKGAVPLRLRALPS